MSVKRVEVKTEQEAEDYEAFAEILKKVMAVSPESRGPAARAIMAGFQVYNDMIGGAPARTQTKTR